ncbi:hypothetical protein MMC16_004858 [Acarospora aff. strigata]|nr:hypothetical protein [Acarospora aff. strigata]
MPLLLAEYGLSVPLNDPSKETVPSVLKAGKQEGQQDKLEEYQTYDDLYKVTQDIDNSERTGAWSGIEAVQLHIPGPTLAATHFIRITSVARAKATTAHQQQLPPFLHDRDDRPHRHGQTVFPCSEDLRMATQGTCMASFIRA